jgi:HAD superfamily hydrolase (TIGR01509 family)
MSFLTIIIVITAILALYWVFYGQRKYNEMFMPQRKTELKAILFDLDGVIVDSFDAWYGVFSHVRKNLELSKVSKEEFRKNIWGTSVQQDAKIYFKNKSVKEIEDVYKILMNDYVHKTKLMPDVEKVLETIKKKNIKIGLVTNSFRSITSNLLKFHKIEKYFDAVVTAEDVEKVKPYPDSVIKLCEKLKVMLDEAILVGDTKNDYKAGKSAGCFVVGLNTKGDLMISKLSDLLELV